MFHLLIWLKFNFLLELKLSSPALVENSPLNFATSSLIKEPFPNYHVHTPLHKMVWQKENIVIFGYH